ncbi:MAG: cob(I)yrinic acid a,c-diamide adenosyltransferase [Verrucomicrobiota bacterium]
MSITTERGDDGETDLLYGKRVSKTHVRVVAGGVVDELNAALGVVRVLGLEDAKLIEAIQRGLMDMMGEIAVLAEDRERFLKGGAGIIDGAAVERLKEEIRRIENSGTVVVEGWALPGAGGSELAARWDLARTVCRRAEREIAQLLETGELCNGELLRYLNRLSDLCWLMARREESGAGK